MRIVLLINPRSGAGRAVRIGAALDAMLRSAAHHATTLVTGPADITPALTAALAGSDALIVLGGDGTIHSVLPALLACGAKAPPPALYHLGSGTENLFARQFHHAPDPAAVVRAIASPRSIPIDCALFDLDSASPTPFVLMASCGPDASIVHRRAAANPRGGHHTYIAPIVREIARPRFAHVRASADGHEFIHDARGLLVIANSRQYAFRHDPAIRADMSDGLLDAVLFPARGRLAMLRWATLARNGAHLNDARLVYQTARQFTVEHLSGPALWQLDGEPVAASGAMVRLSVLPGVLRVVQATPA